MNRHSKRPLNMKKVFLTPSLHHLHHRDHFRSAKSNAFNQNSSYSPIDLHRILPRKNLYSSSYTSLNSYLKEFHLSEKDFFELRHALQTIFQYFQSEIQLNLQQRLTSPYWQGKLENDDQSSLPLYTNEYFIRNGLLNHNDGPEIYDNIFQTKNFPSKSILHFQSDSSLSSSANLSLPLALLSNPNYFLTALTSNFVSEKSRYSRSNMELHVYQNEGKVTGNDSATESIIIRRNKVRTWERENHLQHIDPIKASEYHRSSMVQTPSTRKENRTMKMFTTSIARNHILLQTFDNKAEKNRLMEIKNTDELFPMVKTLAPYIIIRDSVHRNPIPSINIDNTDNDKSVQRIPHLIGASKKRPLNDVLHPSLVLAKRRSQLLPRSLRLNQTNDAEQVHRGKKNYLLAEFQSVLTEISKQ